MVVRGITSALTREIAHCCTLQTRANLMSSTSAMALHEPRVGVGVVVLRHLKEKKEPDVLLIKRGKPPSLNQWSFCGGSLNLGETLVQCAIRECKEETGITLRGATAFLNNTVENHTMVFPRDLSYPVAFTAVDVMDRDPKTDGTLRFHYAVIEVAAVPEDPRAEPTAADDALDAKWFSLSSLTSLGDCLVPNAVEVIEEALIRFDKIPIE
jgi:8-oxo-dGTP diphosphatase